MVFSIPSYLCCGDRFKYAIDERAQGATMLVGRPKTGHMPDALFEKEHIYRWNGERGGDYEAMRRREALASSKKNLTPNGFSYTGPTQKGEGLGSYYGTIGGPIPYYARHRDLITVPTKREPLPRSIYTSRPKKGGYGYAHTGLSDVGCDYIATIYDQPRINARLDREEKNKKMPENPFRPAGRRGFTFDESLMTGTSKVYMMTAPFKEKREQPQVSHFKLDAVWRPAGYVEDKPTRMEYWEDPYRGYDPRVDPKDRVKKASEQYFVPSSRGDNFWYTQSIVMKRM